MPNFSQKIAALIHNAEQQTLVFADVLAFIDAHYHYTPTAFINGELHNNAGDNIGSCKLLAFAQLHHLSQADTLTLFCEHWRAVSSNPDGADHQNIRNFWFWGWGGMAFVGTPLVQNSKIT